MHLKYVMGETDKGVIASMKNPKHDVFQGNDAKGTLEQLFPEVVHAEVEDDESDSEQDEK